MIVTCDACKTVFKLDDSRIPGQGLRVRCSKCQHVFPVMPEVPEDFLAEFGDFERFHKQQVAEASTGATEEKAAGVAEEPHGPSFEAFMEREQPVAKSEAGELPGNEAWPGESERREEHLQEGVVGESRDEESPGLSFEEFMRQQQPDAVLEEGESVGEGSVSLEGSPEEKAPVEAANEKPVSLSTEEPAGVSFEKFMQQEEPAPELERGELPDQGHVRLDFGEPEELPRDGEAAGEEIAEMSDEKPTSPAEQRTDISFEGLLSREEQAAESTESELSAEEIISAETDRPERLATEEIGSEELDLEPGLESEPLEGMVAEPGDKPGEGEPKLSVEAFLKEELDRESEGAPKERPVPSESEKKFEDLMKGKEPGKGYGGRRSSFRIVLLLIVLLIVGGVAYFWWEKRGQSMDLIADLSPTLQEALGKITGLWEEVIGFRKEDLELSHLQGYEDVIGQHQIYVIKGSVTNKSKRARRYVKLKVLILDQAGNRIKESVIFCGNVFTREELEQLSPGFLTGEETLQPKRPKDMVLEAEGTISFMAIFSDLPREGKSFKVEKLEAPGA